MISKKIVFAMALAGAFPAGAAVPNSDSTDVVPENKMLQEVQVMGRAVGLRTSRISTLDVQTINGAELCKAACCNLSESFETNPSVDVSYSDAVTGAKQIRLLGLNGNYVQILSEGMPFIRGLSGPYGLSYVPGPWMESIQVSKGAASVKNGYEAMTGQINVEYKKPLDSDRFNLNLFMADNQRMEGNADFTIDVAPGLSTTTFVHYENESHEEDKNGDGFMDLPAVKQATVMNRWYLKKGGLTSQLGFRLLKESRQSGQVSHHDAGDNPLWRASVGTERLEVFAKNGYVFDPETNTSVGLVTSFTRHQQLSDYGLRSYDAGQGNGYVNLIFQTDLNSRNQLVAGASLFAEQTDETYDDAVSVVPVSESGTEVTSGLFAEYSWKPLSNFSALAGLRLDNSNWYGAFVTPRLHIKYDATSWMHVRANIGKGYRSTRFLSENSYLLASNRSLDLPASLHFQEKAWNGGVSTQFYIPLGGKELILHLEGYTTRFTDQMVADVDADAARVIFRPLNGSSFANVFQTDLSYEPVRGLQMTAAWRFNDVQTTYNGVLREKPLTNRFKGLFTASYQTPLKRWQWDTNIQWNGGGRLPDLNGETNRRFDPFTLVNAQMTRYFRWGSIYVGGENLTSFIQDQPIVGADNPWGPGFDATMVWGPLHGSKLYVGLRYALKKNKS